MMSGRPWSEEVLLLLLLFYSLPPPFLSFVGSSSSWKKIMMSCAALSLAVVYFAVGPSSMRKARRSAVSAKRNGGGGLETMLVTDDVGVRLAANVESFDVLESLGSVEARVLEKTGLRYAVPEFEATREVLGVSGGERTLDRGATAEKWREKTRLPNVALRLLRASKIEAIALALKRYERVVFLDADTFVCASLEAVKCALATERKRQAAFAAFVAVDVGREHGTALLARSPKWALPRTAREANTGVLALRNDSKSKTLLDTWRRAYEDLSRTGFLMDQPAFRTALHATQTPFALLPPQLNCRGHQRRPRKDQQQQQQNDTHTTAVPLRCTGFDTLHPGVQTKLRGGRGCVILHSHDIREEDRRRP